MKKWMMIGIVVAIIGAIGYYLWKRRPPEEGLLPLWEEKQKPPTREQYFAQYGRETPVEVALETEFVEVETAIGTTVIVPKQQEERIRQVVERIKGSPYYLAATEAEKAEIIRQYIAKEK